jgi:hypothetical protein
VVTRKGRNTGRNTGFYVKRKYASTCRITEDYIRDAIWIPNKESEITVVVTEDGRDALIRLHNQIEGKVVGPSVTMPGAYDVRFGCGCTLPANGNELVLT